MSKRKEEAHVRVKQNQMIFHCLDNLANNLKKLIHRNELCY